MKFILKPFYIKLLSTILISCLGILVYSNTFHCSFHFDDENYITNNFAIKNIRNLLNIWGICPCRFVTFFSIALNYHFHQLNVIGYHLFNLAVHIGSALLVWWLTFLTFSTPAMKEQKITQHAKLIALLAGLVFVSHPVQTEAVTYIWQRAASMVAFFYLLSLSLYVKSRLLQDKGSALGPASHGFHTAHPPLLAGHLSLIEKLYYIGSLIAAVAAMFTKENAITLPLVILLYEFYFFKPKKNLNWQYLTPFLLTLLIIPLTMLLTKSTRFQEIQDVVKGPGGVSPMHYLMTQFRVMITYIRLVFLPINQNLDYDYPISKSIFELPALISILFLIAILFFAKRLFLKYRLISFSIFWFFLTLLPESSFLPLKDVIFEHRLYLPMAGYSIFLVGGVYYLLGKNDLKVMAVVLTGTIICYSILTYQRNKIWKDEFTLWNDAVGKSPHKARPYNGRGTSYYKQGSLAQAMSDFNKAIKINPKFTEAYFNRGNVYVQEGDYAQAIFDFNKAIEINPSFAEPYYNRGSTYSKLGNFTLALSDLNRAIKIDPDFEEAYINRGNVYVQEGDYAQAIFDFNKALEINPKDAQAYYNRGTIYAKQGNFTLGLFDLNKAIEINPKNEEAYNNLSFIYSNQGDLTQAMSDANKAIELNPKDAKVYNNRGLIYAKQGNLAQALSDYNQAVALYPEYAVGYHNRAIAYYQLKAYDKAWADVRKAEKLGLQVNPGFINALNLASGNNATPHKE